MNNTDRLKLQDTYLKVLLKEEDDMSSFENETEEDLSSDTSSSESEEKESESTESEDSSEEGETEMSAESMRKGKDVLNLEEAYNIIEENRLKAMALAAALGMGGLGDANAEPNQSISDLANKAVPSQSISDLANKAEPKEEPTSYVKAIRAYEEAIKSKKPASEEIIKDIAGDKEYAKRYAHYLVLYGQKIPDTLKNALGDYYKDLKAGLEGIKN